MLPRIDGRAALSGVWFALVACGPAANRRPME